MAIVLQPAHIAGKKKLKNVCPKCGKIINEGAHFLILIDDGVQMGVVADREEECCGEKRTGPKLYDSLRQAQSGAHMLTSNIFELDLLPMDAIRVE